MQILLGGGSKLAHEEVDVNVFNKIIGQTGAKTTIGFFVSSHNPETPFPTLLFTGSHGLGKTYFASLVAKSLNRKYVEINCGDLQDGDAFMDFILDQLSEPTTIIFDEAHMLSKEMTTILLTFLNPNGTNKNKFVYKGIPVIWDLCKINVVFATTDAYEIFKPLKNRCQEIYFDLYSNDEMFEIVKLYANDITLTCDKDDLSYSCRNRARDAYILATNIRRYTASQNIKEFSQTNLIMLKRVLDVYPLGIKKPELELLQAISKDQPISAANLANKMGLNIKNIERELEPRLRELGLVDSSPRGRILTTNGMSYVKTHLSA